MLITKDFVMLNFPKTGSSFTRIVLKQLYENKYHNTLVFKLAYKLKFLKPRILELILPNIKMPNRKPDQHGTFSQIPKHFLNRPIISVVRNPYTRFLSSYEFRAWANINQLSTDLSTLKAQFPDFPNLDLDAYVDMCYYDEQSRLVFNGNSKNNENHLGAQTIQFVQMFFKDSKSGIDKMNDTYIESGAYKLDMGNLLFLRQEHLREDLYHFLSQFQFKEQELQLIKDYKKVNVTKSRIDKRDTLWTQKAIDYVTYRERYLFMILEDHNIFFEKPII